MTKEYHVFTERKNTHEQAFVFEIERRNEYINILELWIITIQNNGEVKTRINFSNILQKIGENVGGNIDDENINTIVDVFSEVLPKDKKLEVEVDQMLKDIDKACETSSDKLIKASELSKKFETESGNIEQIVQNIINNKDK